MKISSEDQIYVNRLYDYALKNLQWHKPQNSNYFCWSNGSGRFRLEFRKVIYNGQLLGFRNVEICFSPHYLYNNDLHNGNDFTPLDCINTIIEVLTVLEISKNEFSDFQVKNIEYGLNLQLNIEVNKIIDGIIYTKKTPFVNKDHSTNKISDTSKFKRIKAYDKGIQFIDCPQYEIPLNTFRFEVQTKQAKNIRTLGIYSVCDLLKKEIYDNLFQSILNEWEQILIINTELKGTRNTITFWTEYIAKTSNKKDRNKFTIEKNKYYKKLLHKDNLHHLIKCKIIDKNIALSDCANSTQKTPINKGKHTFHKIHDLLINVESAQTNNEKTIQDRYCEITKLDISMQKKSSKFLCKNGLRFYHKNQPEVYKKLCDEYLSKNRKNLELNKQFYYIAHNIRNSKTNPYQNNIHNRKRFEQRNYHPMQMQLQF